jgi:DNA topoisomerase IA
MQNQKLAFQRLVKTKKFQNWLRVESAARMQGFADMEAKIDKLMRPENLKIEEIAGTQHKTKGR